VYTAPPGSDNKAATWVVSIRTHAQPFRRFNNSRLCACPAVYMALSLFLTGVARQPLFSVILSPSIYLSIYVCHQIFTATNRPGVACLQTAYTARLRVYVIYFSAHCAGVTNMSHHYNLSLLWTYIVVMRSSSASQKDYRLFWISQPSNSRRFPRLDSTRIAIEGINGNSRRDEPVTPTYVLFFLERVINIHNSIYNNTCISISNFSQLFQRTTANISPVYSLPADTINFSSLSTSITSP